MSILSRLLMSAATTAFLAASASAAEQVQVGHIPKDAQIIFASDRDHEKDPWGKPANALYVATLEGTVTRITYSKFSNNHFEVSPNRRYIAVNRYSRGPGTAALPKSAVTLKMPPDYYPLRDWKDLWIVDTIKGTERKILPNIDAAYGGLAWSPDSKSLYFSTPSLGKMQIVRVDVESGTVQPVSENLAKLLGRDGEDLWVSDVGLSADGSRLVFVVSGPGVNKGQDKPRIGTMKVDGSEAHFVSTGGPLPAGRRGVWPIGDFDPDPSPDGKMVAFSRLTDGGYVTPALSTFDIIVTNIDGKGEKTISPHDHPAAEFIPSWTWNPSGKLLFTRLDPKSGIGPVVYDPSTGQRQQIDVHGSATHVQWIPPGTLQCQRLVCTVDERKAMEAIWHEAR